MNYQTIEEIYAANDKIREKFKSVVADLPDDKVNAAVEGENWTVAAIVEHLSMVEDGMMKICAKLLREAEANQGKADGEANISGDFLQKLSMGREQKFQAPERVHPSGSKTVAESLTVMDENRARLYEMKTSFETVECADFIFPHPAFGDLSAHEWLALLGGHEMRHTAQIIRILDKIG
jgi:uncharacterized damage-inducible protein DinB